MKQAGIQTVLATVAIVFLSGCATQNQNLCTADASWTRWERSDGGNGHYYKSVAVTNGITWTEADKLARSECGYLATITSAEENTFVFGLIDDPVFFNRGRGPTIGGMQLDGQKEPDGGWCWVSGEAWDFTNWTVGQPDGFATEDRLHFYSGTLGKAAPTWNDISRNSKMPGGYVIEREK